MALCKLLSVCDGVIVFLLFLRCIYIQRWCLHYYVSKHVDLKYKTRDLSNISKDEIKHLQQFVSTYSN